MTERLAIVILAAGKGTRMGGETAKVLRSSFNGPLLQEVMKSVVGLQPEKMVVVTGFQADEVEQSARTYRDELIEEHGQEFTASLEFCIQSEQRGTGDAVKAALPALDGFTGEVLILCGDAPLLLESSLVSLIHNHRAQDATLSLLTAHHSEPGSYGRILRCPDS